MDGEIKKLIKEEVNYWPWHFLIMSFEKLGLGMELIC